MAQVPDVGQVTSSDFKAAGDSIFILGKESRALLGSEILDTFNIALEAKNKELPDLDGKTQFEMYRLLHKAIRLGLVRSCHDCSEGGLLVALAESCIGGDLGAELDLGTIEWDRTVANIMELFFNEAPGRFVVSIAPENVEQFCKLFARDQIMSFGKTTTSDVLRVTREGLVLVDAPISKIRSAWQGERS
jgi:phosphoribosylformylglycinamidine synthase